MVRNAAFTLPFSTAFLNCTACWICCSMLSPRMAASASYRNLWNVYFPAAYTLSLCSWRWCPLKCETSPPLETHFVFLLINYGPLLSTLVLSQNMASLCAAIALFLFICDPNLSSCSTSYAWMSPPLESLCQNCDICFVNPLCQDSNPLAALIFGNPQC